MIGTYHMQISGYDWGCGTSKVVMTFNHQLDAVTVNDFKVIETKQATDFTQPNFPVEEVTVERQIIDAYLCDENGNKIEKASRNVALELYVSPNDGSPLLFTMSTQLNTYSDPYYLTITKSNNAKLTSYGKKVKELIIDRVPTGKTTTADQFKVSQFIATDGVKYHYAYYEPEDKTDTLIVWLHGLGEGGVENTDPYITLLANKVTALASEEFQNVVGKAYILVPQCPTYWMDNDGKKSNFHDGAIIADGTSYYTVSLNELIDSYQDKCGAKKVVLAGCSNGGYMTIVMALNHPHKYNAIVPICEAMPDKLISDNQIQSLVHLPMFFIYSNDDTTVDPKIHEIPTIKRLKNAGAKNLHISTTDHVIDMSGQYKDENKNAYQYAGHWSWIYFDNNDSHCDDCHQNVWQWIGEQVK